MIVPSPACRRRHPRIPMQRKSDMPEVIVYATAGRSDQQKKKLLRSVTEAVANSFEVAREHVVVQIVEAPPGDKAKGGIPFDER
ncbi:tautomerase family protein [Pseudomonas entomophila]